MNRMPVNYQINSIAPIMDQTVDKFAKNIGGNRFIGYHKVHFAFSIYCRNHVQTKPGSSGGRFGRLPTWRPRGPRMIIGTNTRFIRKKYRSMFSFGQRSNPWEFICHPLVNRIRVLLICSKKRSLAGQSQLCQQPAHRYHAHRYTELSLNQITNHFSCPQSKLEFQLQRIFPYNSTINPSNSRGVQFRWTPKQLLCLKRIPSSGIVCGKPAVNNPRVIPKATITCSGL